MKAIVKLLLESVMEFVLAFYEREKAKVNQYTVLSQKRLIESITDVRKAELKINKAVGPVSISPQAWNQKVGLGLALSLAALLLLSGCLVQTIYVQSPLPIIGVPDRPVLLEFQPFTEREQKLAIYAATLEARIEGYNAYAREQNANP